MPGTRPLVPDQLVRSLLSGARMPLAASVGVSVLPSSVMSGMFLPDDSALFQSVVRLPHGTHLVMTWVLAYCGNSVWNSLTTLFIQVICEGTEPPSRQTVSVAGPVAAGLAEVAGALDGLEPAGVLLPVAAGVV